MKKIILLMFTAFLVLSVSAQTEQMMDKKQQNIVAIASLTGKQEQEASPITDSRTKYEHGRDILNFTGNTWLDNNYQTINKNGTK